MVGSTTATWQGNSDNWDVTTDWSPTGLPGSNANVIINSGDPQITTSVGAVATVADNSNLTMAGGTLTATGAFTNTGTLNVDDYFGAKGGSSLSIGGLLTNSGAVYIGDGYADQSAATTVTVNGLSNTGTINLEGNGSTYLASLVVQGPAGFGSAGELTGNVNLLNDAAIIFASGQITDIAATSELALDDADSVIADAGAPASNSALDGLATIEGNLSIFNGSSISTTGGIANSGTINVDDSYGIGGGGSSLTIGGALTNSGTVDIGDPYVDQDKPTTVTVNALSNTGTINLNSQGATYLSSLIVKGPAGFGAAGVLTGNVNLINDTLLEFASGQVNSIAANSELTLNGADAYVADAGALTSNSALTGLSTVTGSLGLENGASVSTTGAVTNAGSIYLENSGSLSTKGAFANTGTLGVDEGYNNGGSSLSIGGVLTNSGTVNVGDGGYLNAASTLTAQGLANTGTINVASSSATTLATLDVGAAAGFGTAGVVTGQINLTNDALLEFASGQITSITANNDLTLNGADAFVADAGALTSNSALKGLTSNAGGLALLNGSSVATTGAFANTGTLGVDEGYNNGGSSLSIGGVLTNSGTVNVGDGGYLNAASTLTAQGLANTGTINVASSSATTLATLDVGAAAGFGTAGVVTGQINLTNDALLEFASGQITSITANNDLTLNGADAFVADAGALTSNSALKGLTSNAGGFALLNGSSVATTGAFANTGTLGVDEGYNNGGSSLSIGGVLTNSGTVNVGDGGYLNAASTLTAQGLANTGTINVASSSATTLATLDVGAAAGFGTAGVVTGQVNLTNDALLEFASGQITSITANNDLTLNGADAFVADAGALTSNSALKGLTSNAGGLALLNGSSVATTGAFANTGTLGVDEGYNNGGSSLSIGGVLTNSGTVNVGDGGYLNAASTLTAQGLANTGTINVASSSATTLATLDVGAAAGFGTAGVVTGQVNLTNDALLEFASGQITSITANNDLTLNGADAFVADAGALTSNSALKGLTSNAGGLALLNGSSVATTGAFANTGTLGVDEGYNNGGSSLSIGGVLTNSGTVNVGDGGYLNAASTLTAQGLANTGTINVASSSATTLATLDVNGTAENAGSIYASVGSRFQVNGAYEQTTAGTLTLQVQGTSAGQFATVATTGGVTLNGGTLNTPTANFSFAAGQTFNLFTFTPGQLVGMFSDLGAQADGATYNLGNGLLLGLEYNNSAGVIEEKIVAAPASTADSWTGGSANWSTTADWSNGAPDFYSAVTISTGSTATVTLSNDVTIDNLTLGAGDSLTTAAATDLSVGAGVATAATSILSIGGEAFVDGAAVNDGSIVAAGTLVDIRGAVTGTGSFTVDANATLELGAADAETVNFAGASATLKLDTPASFAGVLANMGVGDAIDLAGIDVTSAVVSGSVLTVTQANASTLTFNLSNFPGGAGFSVQSDSAGGSTLIVIPPSTNVTFNEVDGNDVINYAQAHAAGGVALSGTVTGLATGATFEVSVVDGNFSKSYTATVGTGGVWTATLPSADAIALGAGAAAFTATVNASTTATQTVTIAETLPIVTIASIDGNDVINAAEAKAGVALSGTATGLAVGATFHVSVVDGTFNKSYTATVGAGGAWTATIPSTDAVTLGNGTATVSAQVTDAYGNPSALASQSVTVAETPPTVTIAEIDGNDVINAAQAKAGVSLSGTVTGLAVGATFNVSVVDGTFSKTYTATVGAGGAWTATIPSTDAVTLGNGTATVRAQVTDAYGNPSALASQTVTVAGNVPAVTIAAIDGNDVINAAEAKAGVSLSGTVTGLAVGATFSVSVVDGTFSKTYTATVGAGGAWTATIPSTDAITLGNGMATVSAQVTDAYGNSSALASQSVTVEETPPTVVASMSVPGATTSTSETISETAAAVGAGNSIASVLVYDGATKIGAATLANGVWSLTDSNLALGAHDFSTVTTDADGNSTTTTLAPVTVTSSVAPAVTASISTPGLTKTTSETISETATASAGNTIASVEVLDNGVSVGAATYNSTTQTWSLTETGLTNGVQNFSTLTTDSAGNTTTTALPQVDVAIVAPVVTASESVSGLTNKTTDTITETATADPVGANAIAAVEVYDGTTELGAAALANGIWTFTTATLADGVHDLSLETIDTAGNVTTTTLAAVDVATQKPTVTASESVSGTTTQTSDVITATATAEAVTGDSIASVLVYDGTTELGAATLSNGAYSYTASNLALGAHDLSVVATDAAGNSTTSTLASVTVISSATPPTVSASQTLYGLTNLNVDTISETATAASGLTIAGVEVLDNGKALGAASYGSATGLWSLTTGVLADGANDLSTVTTDSAGNTTTTTLAALDIATRPPTVTASESVSGPTNKTSVTISETAAAEAVPGDVILLVEVLNGATNLGPASLNPATGAWTYTETGLADGVYTFDTVTVDAAGNETTTTLAAVDVATKAPTVTASESISGLTGKTADTISETATAEAVGTNAIKSVEILDGTTTLGAAALSNGTWTFTTGTLADGVHALSTVTTDAAGNVTTTALAPVDVATKAPTVAASESLSGLTDKNVDVITETATAEVVGTNAIKSVEVYDGTTALGAATLANGAWTFSTAALADGVHDLSTVTTDTAGNVTTTTLAAVDVATKTPTVTASESLSGLTDKNVDVITETATAEVVGTNAIKSVEVYDGTTALGAATLSNGTWTFSTAALADGVHDLSTVTTDTAGNVTTTTLAAVDVATKTPTVTASESLSGLTDKNVDVITETATAEAVGTNAIKSVEVYDGTAALGAATLSNGTWTFTTGTLVDGVHDLSTLTTDTAGNVTTANLAALDVATKTPTVTASETVSGLTTATSDTITETATAEAVGANAIKSVEVYDLFNGVSTALGAATLSNGTWSYTASNLAFGVHAFSTVTTDNAGNVTTTTLAADNVEPPPPKVTIALVQDSSNGKDITNDDALTGAGDDNAVAHFTIDGVAVPQTATANASGAWTFTPTGLSQGAHTIVASETNGGGAGTASIAFTYDSVIPTVTIATPSGEVANATETIDGSGEASTTIQLYDGTTKLGGAVTVGANGLWSDTVTLPNAGANAIAAQDTDAANNVGVSAVTTLTLDNQIVGAAGAFTVVGTNGADHITVGAGNIVVATLGGDDTVTLTSAGGAGQFHVIAGGGGSDTLDLSQTSGGAIVNLAKNTATGAQIGTNYVFNFNNIIGGGGAETLTGSNGGGFIQAGSGNDVIAGGAGADTFEFLAAIGNDTVSNFVASGANHGVIEFDQALFANWNAVNAALTNTSAGAEITLGAGENITFAGVTAAQLQANHVSDFKFV